MFSEQYYIFFLHVPQKSDLLGLRTNNVRFFNGSNEFHGPRGPTPKRAVPSGSDAAVRGHVFDLMSQRSPLFGSVLGSMVKPILLALQNVPISKTETSAYFCNA